MFAQAHEAYLGKLPIHIQVIVSRDESRQEQLKDELLRIAGDGRRPCRNGINSTPAYREKANIASNKGLVVAPSPAS